MSHIPSASPFDPFSAQFQAKLLEVNAEPAIELTGPRLTWILQDLFNAIGEVCVRPFVFGKQGKVDGGEEEWKVGQTRLHLRKCLASEVRGMGGW